jgi:hypothetical protein
MEIFLDGHIQMAIGGGIMPEVFTCECGNQTWTLYALTLIECSQCRKSYRPELHAEDFNLHRDVYDLAPERVVTEEE